MNKHFDNEILDFSTVINAPINEPPLPRRKKCPELAYRHHEFIADHSADKVDSSVTRARVSFGVCKKSNFYFSVVSFRVYLAVI
jgi:hypothetical protein